MRNIYKMTAIVGVLGLSGIVAFNLLDREETVSKNPVISALENKQQESQEAIEFSSKKPEELVSSAADISVDEMEGEIIDLTDLAVEQDKADQSKLSESDALADSDPLAAVEPFLGHEAGLKYDEFFAQLDSEDSVTEEQIQAFFDKMSATLETSDEARDAIARTYSNTENKMKRGILTEMLMRTDAGREILLNDAKSILANGQEERFSDMFLAYQNVDEKLNTQVLDQALISAATSKDLVTATSALNYIGRLEDAKEFSPIYINQATSSLEHIALYNENEDVRSLATQKLYRLLGPGKSSAVAQYHIENNVSAPLMIETLHSIGSGDIKLNPDLKNSLETALSRSDVTAEEKELAKEVLPAS